MNLNLDGFDRLYLAGDEDGGVGLECRDHWDGGRPFAYYARSCRLYDDDPKVTVVETVADLMSAGRAHLDEHHIGAD